MSLPDPVAAKPARRGGQKKPAVKSQAPAKLLKGSKSVRVRRADASVSVEKKAAPANEPSRLEINAAELAKELERGLAEARLDVLSPKALQALMAGLCKTFAASAEAGNAYPIIGNRNAVTSTDVMMTCVALLRAADLQVFELGMWQSWTGR